MSSFIPPASQRAAFTLMELLVVITIIAVLLSISLPLLGMVRSASRTLGCANNQRQLATMSLGYALDRKGLLPPAYLRDDMDWLGVPGASKSSNFPRVFGIHLQGYSSSNSWDAWWRFLTNDQSLQSVQKKGIADLFICGESRYRSVAKEYLQRSDTTWYNEWCAASYGANTAVLGLAPTPTNLNGSLSSWANRSRGVDGWPGYGIGITGLVDSKRKLGRISAPGQVILLAEHDGSPFTNGAQYTNWTDAPFVRTPVDGSGNPLTAPTAWGTPVGTWPWNESKWLGYAVRVSHRGRSNYAFHDGHVESLTPWETCAADPSQPNLWTGVR